MQRFGERDVGSTEYIMAGCSTNIWGKKCWKWRNTVYTEIWERRRWKYRVCYDLIQYMQIIGMGGGVVILVVQGISFHQVAVAKSKFEQSMFS